MRWNQIRLYSFTAPLFLLPLLDISISGAWDYVRGPEFRAIAANLITQVITNIADDIIVAGMSAFFAAVGI